TRFPRLGWKLERHLRHVDDHAIGVGQRERPDVELVADIDHEARAALIAADADIARHRIFADRTGLGFGRTKTPGGPWAAEQDCPNDDAPTRRADRHRVPIPLRGPLLLH